jgi:uncharacterized protein (TIGR02118 family)
MVKLIILLRTGNYADEHIEAYNEFLMGIEGLPGLRRKSVSTVYGASGGRVPYRAVIEAYFDSHQDMEAALLSPAGVRAGQMLAHFAGPNFINLFADVLEESYTDPSPTGDAPADI